MRAEVGNKFNIVKDKKKEKIMPPIDLDFF
jgi:hypothetical protein